MLAKYYNVSLDYLAGTTNNKRGISLGELTTQQQLLMDTISNLDKEEAEKFCEILKLFAAAVKKTAKPRDK